MQATEPLRLIHAGQASGAVAAVSLRHGENPAEFYLQPQRLAEIWSGLLEPKSAAPLVIWPFADVAPFDPDFVAIQQLALRRLLPLGPSDTHFYPDQTAASAWVREVTAMVAKAGYEPPSIVDTRTKRRRNIAAIVWNHIQSQPIPSPIRKSKLDADGDGIPNVNDPLPFTVGSVSWKVRADGDGLPDVKAPYAKGVLAFNFTSAKGSTPEGFQNDVGLPFSDDRGYRWRRDLSGNTRLRKLDSEPLRDGFVFTRQQDVWECKVANGRWKVHACFGDSGHPQPGQHLSIEGQIVAENIETDAGYFHEVTSTITVRDGYLTLTLGAPEAGSNTCVNWVTLAPIE